MRRCAPPRHPCACSPAPPRRRNRSATCFRGFEADTENSFWQVYGDIFSQIAEWDGKDESPARTAAPPSFGGPDSTYADVRRFYAWWGAFSTKRSFAWRDLHDIREVRRRRHRHVPMPALHPTLCTLVVLQAPGRQVRRAMERENTRARSAARKDFSRTVRELAEWVSRRDPRVREEREREKQRQGACVRAVRRALLLLLS